MELPFVWRKPGDTYFLCFNIDNFHSEGVSGLGTFDIDWSCGWIHIGIINLLDEIIIGCDLALVAIPTLNMNLVPSLHI
jgi:hypothetical protein